MSGEDLKVKGGHNAHLVYRPDIDGLRAVAILSVLFFHAFPSKLRGGFVGVDIFFVISGFLISSIIFRSLERDSFSFSEFYAHRIRRIFPALLVVLLSCCVAGWFLLLPDDYRRLGKHVAAGSGFVQNFVLWGESGYFDTSSALKPLMHLWSLAIEEQFYLIYPVIVVCAWRLGRNFLFVLIALLLVSFSLNIFEIYRDSTKAFFLPQMRFWELLFGAGVAYINIYARESLIRKIRGLIFHEALFRRSPSISTQDLVINNGLSIFGFALIVASLITIHHGRLFPGWWALAPVSGACLVILSGPDAWINRYILSTRVMVFVGLISYPLYLWHWPLLSFVHLVEGDISSRGLRIAVVVLSLVLAWLTYKLVERPLRFGRNTWIKTAAITISLFLVGSLGYKIFDADGFENRTAVKGVEQKIKDLSWDLNRFNYVSCESELVKESPTLGYCSKSKVAPPTAVILGDSHAEHIFPGIANNDERSWLLIGNHSCPPVTDVNVITLYGECQGLMTKAIDYVVGLPSVDTVVLSFFGSYALDVSYAADHLAEGGGLDTIKMVSDKTLLKTKKDLLYFGLDRTISKIESSGKRVIFVIDVPELPFFLKDCISKPLVRSASDCKLPRSEVIERQAVQREIVDRLITAHPGIRVFDSVDIVCDEKTCNAVSGDGFLYRDSHHLSVRGSNIFARDFLSWLKN
ncbi:acyltransferase family protein [Pseudomonas protegens]|uniref:acyltransferase family protein n=1 Tax=Pseudomonas protegens TaxID=380021 RepID=UPI0022829637|nr:acyltransferase family protein [Pseudomonas protegens]MCY7264379.1 acyltransferase [Pseudomonas protegens]